MSYRPDDFLGEKPLPKREQKKIDKMTEAQALGEVLEAAESWHSEVSEYIFQELDADDEQPGYALSAARREKAIAIVSSMLRERKEFR